MTGLSGTTGLAPWQQSQLQALLRQPGHAVLLTGPAGMGHYALSMALAQAWLCEQPSPQGACGVCGSCHSVGVKTHPDLKMLLPETLAIELGWPLDPKTQEKIDKKEIKPSKWIRVDSARNAVAFNQLTQSRGRGQVMVIYPADKLGVESANALLKTLEEPSGAARFIVATEAPHLLLPTMRSRCVHQPIVGPEQAEAQAWLGQHCAASSADIVAALQATGQRPDEAFEWLEQGFTAAQWAQLPQAMAAGDWRALAGWPLSRQMDAMQKLCHDLMVSIHGAPPRYFAPSDLPKLPSQQSLMQWQQDLQQASRTLEHPFGASLLQDAWALRAVQAMRLS